MPGVNPNKANNLFLKMRPLHRMFLGIAFSLAVYFIIPGNSVSPLLLAMLLWITFAFVFTLSDWIILFTRPIEQIKRVAQQDDGSKVFVFTMIVISSFASMFTVLLLIVSGETKNTETALFVPVAVGGMLLAWLMTHTVFIFHYAHLYYGDDERGAAAGLNFPGEEAPDYIDFAYFSFVIGCTFQVSDVEISSKRIRRVVLLHGLLSFALNTFVVALTINLVAGLSK